MPALSLSLSVNHESQEPQTLSLLSTPVHIHNVQERLRRHSARRPIRSNDRFLLDLEHSV